VDPTAATLRMGFADLVSSRWGHALGEPRCYIIDGLRADIGDVGEASDASTAPVSLATDHMRATHDPFAELKDNILAVLRPRLDPQHHSRLQLRNE
jgi:hypothetical protein